MKKKILVIFLFITTACDVNLGYNLLSQQLRTEINMFGLLTVDMRLMNRENKTFQDFTVYCKTYGVSGTMIQKLETKIYQKLPAYDDIDVTNIKMGFVNSQTTRVDCHFSA